MAATNSNAAPSASPPRSVFQSFANLGSPGSRGGGTPCGGSYRSPTAYSVDHSANGLDDDEAFDADATAALYGPSTAGMRPLTPSVGSALYTASKAQYKKDLMSYYDVDPVAVLQRLKAASSGGGRRSDAQSSISSTWHDPAIHEPIIESQRGKLVTARDRKTPYDPLDGDEVAQHMMFGTAIMQQRGTKGALGSSSSATGGGGGAAGSRSTAARGMGPASPHKYYIDRSASEVAGVAVAGVGGTGTVLGDEPDYNMLPTPAWLSAKDPKTTSMLPARPLPTDSILNHNDVLMFRDEEDEARRANESYILAKGAPFVAPPQLPSGGYYVLGGAANANGKPLAVVDPRILAARAAVQPTHSNASAYSANNGDLALDLTPPQQDDDDLHLDLEDPMVKKARLLADERRALEALRWRATPGTTYRPPVVQQSPNARGVMGVPPAGAASPSSPLSHFGNFAQPEPPKKPVAVKAAAEPPASPTSPASPLGAKGAKGMPPALGPAGKKGLQQPPAPPMSPAAAKQADAAAAAAAATAAAEAAAAEEAAKKEVVFIPPVPTVERPTLKQLEERAASLAYNPASYQDYLFEKYLQESTVASPTQMDASMRLLVSPTGGPGVGSPLMGGALNYPPSSPARGLVRAQQQQDVLAKTHITAVLHDPLRTGNFYDPFHSFRWWELGADNDAVLAKGGVSSAGPHPDTGVMMFADRFNNLTFGPYVLHPMRLWMVDYLAEKVSDLDDPVLRKIDNLLVNNMSNVWEVEKMLVKKYGIPNSYATAPPSLKFVVEYPPESGIEFVPLSEAMSRDMVLKLQEIEEDRRLQEERSKKRSAFETDNDDDDDDGGSPASPSSPTSPSSPKSGKKVTVAEPASPTGKKDTKGDKAAASPTADDGKKDKKGATKDDGKKDKKDKGGDDKKDKSDKKEKGDKSDKKEKGDKADKKDKSDKKEKGDKKEKSDKKEKKK